jgi:hypothetical protein
MTKTQNITWFVVPLVLMVVVTILTMLAIHASIQNPLELTSVTWNANIIQEFCSVTWNSGVSA